MAHPSAAPARFVVPAVVAAFATLALAIPFAGGCNGMTIATVTDDESPDASRVLEGNDAAACTGTVIHASSYDQSCTTDSDCVAVAEGNACIACGFNCANAVINVSAQAQYRADIANTPAGSSESDPACVSGCPAEFVPCCRAGQCRTDSTCSMPAPADAGIDATPDAASPPGLVDANAGLDTGATDASRVPDSGSDGAADSGSDGAAAPASFENDVMPIFQQGCTLSSVCHGQANNAAEENLYLGDAVANTPAIIAQVYAGLVGVKSDEDPSMNQVTAGDVANSYLSHKLVGDQGSLASQCAAAAQLCGASCTAQNPCGASMPYLGEPLRQQDVDAINAWIAQGAQNN